MIIIIIIDAVCNTLNTLMAFHNKSIIFITGIPWNPIYNVARIFFFFFFIWIQCNRNIVSTYFNGRYKNIN